MGTYEDVFRASTEDPESFWLKAAEGIDWDATPHRALDSSGAPFYRWFPDGRLNVCFNALDRHVEAGRGEQPALVYDSPVTGTRRTYTYTQLRDEVAAFAGALAGLGVGHGDRVVIYMPMVPEAAVAMLACARIGAVHSVVFGGFAPREPALRIDDAAPKAVVSASCGIEGKRVIAYKPLLDQAIELAAHKPDTCVLLQRPQERAESGPDGLDWADAVAAATPADCLPVAATDPLYILYTSGTTGKPKGVVRDCGGYTVALQWSMGAVYDAGPGETMFTGTDAGWIVGHSYIVYGPLPAGATTVLYEGKPVGTPDAGQFWRVAADHRVKTMFTAPTAFPATRKEDPKGTLTADHDLSGLRHLFLAGERLAPETHHWASTLLGIPVIDHWWQTETGRPIVANPVGIEAAPPKPGSPTRPLPGWHIRVLDTSGEPVPAGVDGAIMVKLPLPPGTLPTLWNDDDRYVATHLSAHDGYHLTGDNGHTDDDGYVFVMGRTDDVINVAGHRLSTDTMEEALAAHPDVAECAVIGVADALKAQIPRGFVVLKTGSNREPGQAEAELVQLVRTRIGPVAPLNDVTVVAALPKTRSGKILRKTMRGIADGHDEPTPSTVDDPAVIETLRPVLRHADRTP
ncbi:AMP-binding protein [Streptomyces sp. NPDC013157]|uniref:AMP-binding protein n=1 Tax=Streptomyces sp. NPDC013157 TaxID=3364861 RepID=UPI003684933C